MIGLLRRGGARAFNQLGRLLSLGFGARLNPLNYLGALTIFFFWIALISGIWLFMFFRTSVDGAYESVEQLTHGQWYFGGIMRSLHRYASDAAVVAVVFHIVQEWVKGHAGGKRWFSWITGIPLLWIVIPLGITGYWLVWDKLAQYVALTAAELIDWLPIFTDAMARNFLSNESVSNRFFTLMAFLHLIGLPLFLVFGIWLHVFRISRPRINPPRTLMAGTLIFMLLAACFFPALSQGKADLSVVPQSLALDWYYLLIFPLVESWSPGAVWALLVGFSGLLFVAPWLPPAKIRPVAQVDLDNCNGCRRCVDDCPYSAVMMQLRTDGSRYTHEAVVDPALCVSCGICVGACPTATPFRKASALVAGIDLPDLSAALLRDQVESLAEALQGTQKVMIFTCEDKTDLQYLSDKETAVIPIRCMAQLPPPFIDYILSRNLADGVMLAACENGGCDYRFGQQWTEQRIQRKRDPQLRKRIDQNRIAMTWEDCWGSEKNPLKALQTFRQKLASMDQQGEQAEPDERDSFHAWRIRLPLRAMFYSLFGLIAFAFSAWPLFELRGPNESMIALSFSHAGQRTEACRRLTQAEMEQLPPNMRKPSECARGRLPLSIIFQMDGKTLYQAVKQASGIWSDGEATVYARFPVPAGQHELFIGMVDSTKTNGYDYAKKVNLVLQAGQKLVVEFDQNTKTFVFH